MKRTWSALGGSAVAAMLLAAPAQAGDLKDIGKGAVIGGAGGAVVGAVVPGISTGEGALIGAAGGAVIGGVSKNRKYYRDRNGNKYYVGKDGRRHYKR